MTAKASLRASFDHRLGQIFLSLATLVVALIPLWLWLAIKYVAQPQAFWQNLVLAGLGSFFLGSIQVILIVCGAAFLFVIWTEA